MVVDRLGDRREVRLPMSIMFIDLVGSTQLSVVMEDEDYAALIADYRRLAGELIRRHGGFVPKDEGDGRFVWFGWPTTRRDDAKRAVALGRDLVDNIGTLADRLGDSEHTVTVRIGVHTGPVLVTFPESADKPDIQDATVNFAAKVQQAAEPGTLLISEATLAAVDDAFEVVDGGRVTIAGLDGGIQVYEVLGPAPATGPGGPFVGRSAELYELETRWASVADGGSAAVMITGTAGLGKSRLAAELARRSGAERVVRIQAIEERSTIPFGALAPAVEHLADHHLVDPWTPSADRARDLTELVERFSVLAAATPTLVIVEDGHWLDASSAEAIAALGRANVANLMVVMTTRRRPADRSDEVFVELALKPLGSEAARELVTELLPTEHDTPIEPIIERAAGNPFFLLWLSRVADDTGFGGVRRLLRPRSGVPAVIQQAVRSQIDEAAVDDALTATASVIGEEFTASLLARVLDRPEHEVGRDLDRLTEFDIVAPDAVVSGRYRFSHGLVRDLAYDLLVGSDREHGHGRVADTLVAERSTEHAVIGLHLDKAGRPGEACQSLLLAAQACRTTSAYREAEALLGRIFELIGVDPSIVDDELALAARELDATFAVSVDPRAYRAAAVRSGEVLGALQATDEIRRVAMAKTREWAAAMMGADMAASARILFEVRRQGQRGAPEVLPFNRGARAHHATYRGHYTLAQRHLVDALAEVEADGLDPWLEENWATPDDPIALTNSWAPLVFDQCGRRQTAIEYLERAWQRATTIPGGAHTMAHVGANAAVFWELVADGAATLENGEQIAEIGRELDLPFWQLLGDVHVRRGRALLDPTPELCEQLDADAAVFDATAPLGASQAHLEAARAWRAIGEMDRAGRAIDAARRTSARHRVTYLDAEACRLQAGLSRGSQRLALLDEAVIRAERQGAVRYALRALTDLAEIAADHPVAGRPAGALLRDAIVSFPEPDDDPDIAAARRIVAPSTS